VTYSQPVIKNYSKENGLTSNNISVSMIDSKGAIWLGTGNGVSVFTNSGWVNIKSISSSDNRYNKFIGRVNRLFEASNGNIWVCGEKGVFLYNGEYWTYFDDDEDNGFYVVDLFEDTRGWIWILFEKQQSLKDLSDLGFSMIEGIVQMYDGELWHKFDGYVGGSAAVKLGLERKYFTSHIIDSNGNIWITSLDGIYKFNGSGWIDFEDVEMLSDDCTDVMEDPEGNIWVATEQGVAVNKGSDVWIEYKNEKGIKGNDVEKLYLDSNNVVWALSRKDNFFKSLCYFENDKVFSFKKEKLKLKGDVEDLIFSGENVIAYSNKGVSMIKGNSWVCITSQNKINDINYSNFNLISDGVIFTGKKGLYSLQNEKIETLFRKDDSWKVSCLKVVDDRIYIGTEKSGLYVFDCTQTGPCSVKENYNTSSGLPDDYIKDIISDSEGRIWIITKSGISLIDF
jgi:ligand-binding sensor domain-containing protein